jgi:hypothetical protein
VDHNRRIAAPRRLHLCSISIPFTIAALALLTLACLTGGCSIPGMPSSPSSISAVDLQQLLEAVRVRTGVPGWQRRW